MSIWENSLTTEHPSVFLTWKCSFPSEWLQTAWN